jgi:hypothetical protein
MNELDLLVENYFTDSFEVSDLFRLVEQVMNEGEGQTGTAFEDVIVALAKHGTTATEYDDKGKLVAHTGGVKGTTLYNPKGKNKPYKGESFAKLATRCLRKMNYTMAQIKDGVDKNARKGSGTGVDGDPKTDVVIDGKNISLKLPGDIQFSSGAAKSTISAMNTAYEEWVELPHIKEKLKVMDNSLRAALDSLVPKLEATAGRKYYPHERGTRGDWRKYADAWEEKFGKTYEAQLASRAQWDWERNKYPSAGIPTEWKQDIDTTTGEKTQVGPKQKFPKMMDYIEEFIAQALQSRSPLDVEETYEQFKNNALVDIKKEISELASKDDDFYYILIDEWLTGRRQFEGEQVADWLLSPWGFDDIRTEEETKKLAEKWKNKIGLDMRAKARSYLGKEMAVRIDFKADNYYKEERDKYLKRLPENLESNK